MQDIDIEQPERKPERERPEGGGGGGYSPRPVDGDDAAFPWLELVVMALILALFVFAAGVL